MNKKFKDTLFDIFPKEIIICMSILLLLAIVVECTSDIKSTIPVDKKYEPIVWPYYL